MQIFQRIVRSGENIIHLMFDPVYPDGKEVNRVDF
jgi:hypothetical protein